MPIILHPCKSFLCFSCNSFIFTKKSYTNSTKQVSSTPHKFCSFPNIVFSKKVSILSDTHFKFSSRNSGFDGVSSDLSREAIDDEIQELESIELLNKPSPVFEEMGQEKPSKEEVLAPFLKFFKGSRDYVKEVEEDNEVLEVSEEKDDASDENEKEDKEEKEKEEDKKVNVEYYEPKPGDFVVGVVVSGNENKLDVNVGADLLGTMLTKEVLPLNGKEMDNLLCDVKKDAEDFMVRGKLGIVKNDEIMSGVSVPGRPVVETGTILFAEVLGRTLSGRPLISTRRLFRRTAWHRVRQIQQLNEPIEVRITEWNAGGLLTTIEGLRAFLPKVELVTRVNSFTDLKENVGRCMYVEITQIDEAKNSLLLSEKNAWVSIQICLFPIFPCFLASMFQSFLSSDFSFLSFEISVVQEKQYLREGTLLDGTVKKIYRYGAQIKIVNSNRSGLLHVSKISRAEVASVSDILSVDEEVKVLVVKSLFPDKISLSIADLESEPGLFLSNKERVYLEANMMAKKYKQKLPSPPIDTARLEPLPNSALPFENEELYANWKWFKFEK
ncbi:protein PIGMENT DEFECTIVE 338, chloroplastic-like isoform X1 [Trifolium pratense]|uniref:protein PIGMENT DEFECTIVE 338, chloroplastic-like isoform X1 n=1 Tax=Trifolium pratense TaxID=57577 RepID=UPI001E694604|nr:protein PIGMENT DEFECTIVE 338, chloroplastic-like isoform X1 [Trifolium pratense]